MIQNTKPRIEAILFDLDGTLIDTELSAAKVVAQCFQEWHVQITPEDTAYVTGRTWARTCEYLFGKYRIPLDEESAKQHLLAHYREELENNLCVVPGSSTAVKLLAEHFPLGLVSGSGRADILWALKKLDLEKYFKIILGAEDYPCSKPEPDGYLKAIQFLNQAQSSCLVFEDSAAGIASARKAGMWVAAITSTNHFAQDQSQAHIQIQDLTNVTVQWVKNLSFD